MDNALFTAVKIVNWLLDIAGTAKELLVPISGGTDSALGLWLCTQALPNATTGVYLGDALPNERWFASLDCKIIVAPHPEADGTNREAARWAYLLRLAYDRKAWLVGSRTRTEDVLGLYSVVSRVATILPIAGLWKSEVLAMCEEFFLPPEMIAASKRADPECGRPQELVDITYQAIDNALRYLTSDAKAVELADKPNVSNKEWAYLMSVRDANAYKHLLPRKGPHGK